MEKDMGTTIKNGQIVSFSNTPQANDDFFQLSEDQLLASLFFTRQTDILSLNVTSNDLGGNAKTLYSVDDGINYLKDLLTADILVNGVSAWEATSGSDLIRIENGNVDVDLSA